MTAGASITWATIGFLLPIGKERFGSCIDIGCGDGRLTKEIQTSFPEKLVMGIDYSARAINLAKSMNPSGRYAQIDIVNQSINEQFDIGILMEVFEHINPEEAEKFISGITRLLKPKAKLFVTVPHVNKPVEYKHFRHFTSELLIKCFGQQFEAEEIIPIEKGKRRKALIDTLLGNRFFILNNARLRQLLYRYYTRNLFLSPESDCKRIIVKFALK